MNAAELARFLGDVIPTKHLASTDLLDAVARHWCERQRFWHGPRHLLAMLEEISRATSGQDREVLLLAALYHDAMKWPRSPGLLSAYLADLEFPSTVVRGVRDGTDLEADLRFARFLNELRPGTGVVWISCEPEFQRLSSSAIRELESIEPGAALHPGHGDDLWNDAWLGLRRFTRWRGGKSSVDLKQANQCDGGYQIPNSHL